MARTTGPLFSADASGSMANLLTFSKWKGRTYVKMFSQPTGERTPVQASVRAMMGFLNSAWNGPVMTQAHRDAWLADSRDQGVAPLNAYLTAGLDRWTHFTAPQVEPGYTAGGVLSNISATWTATGGKGIITITWHLTTLSNGWGLWFHADQSAVVTVARENLLYIEPLGPLGDHTTVITGVPPGTYNIKRRGSNWKGQLGSLGGSKTTTVT